jgi:predicted XRE-type DNA-binding protein
LDFKPLPDVGPGAIEIRLHGHEYRVFYLACFEEAGTYSKHCWKCGDRNEGKANMKTTRGTTITKGSGNVFADLGFSLAESRNLQLRSEMMTVLRKFIAKERWTQAEAAKRLKVTQPRISDLTRGKISRFSQDTLVNMLTDAGLGVDFRIKPLSRRVA